MRVAVIIVTYNAAKYVPDCLGSLSRIEKGGHDVDVIVIDNGSSDATVEMLATRGVVLINGPMDRPWGIRTASFADPDGYIWEIAK